MASQQTGGDGALAAPNLPEYSVSEISAAVKRSMEDNFGYVRVRGEVSGFTQARSGHLYFSLKDDRAVLDGVCWRGTAGKLRFRPEDGLEVICTGKLTTYAPRSRYQLVVEAMEPAGVGALMALLEERRKKLAAEGLFEAERKRPLPYLPEVIGVVTSPTGAVIRDILHRLRDRFPRRVLLWPVLVQGEGAAEQVAAAIGGFNALTAGGAVPRPDLLIVARGGGSIEDLWAFNEEIVVRAAAASEIPLISAVGHETDTTLIDHAADRRAPTPSAAAEIAVPVRGELVATTGDLQRRLRLGLDRLLAERRRDLEGLARGLRGPRDLLALAQQRLDEGGDRLRRALAAFGAEKRHQLTAVAARLRPQLLRTEVAHRLEQLADRGGRLGRAALAMLRQTRLRLETQTKVLESLSFERVLERGFALVRDADGAMITAAAQTAPGQAVALRFHDGEAPATIDGAPAGPAKAAPRTRKAKPKRGEGGGQGTLF
ncbi:MAG: exodeoxyribonuclease VII large subunit [Alphaproteobacteria bacterium]|jgi:exodeoxyribonuclease VII large subunit|nr:exodeoxyribonuclease VII large subunit [Alphaproteobacteria bacterium]MDP6813681.1 exodeoxyribonuclease VII large subunit [Alphaproteobacteria bacterium]